MCFLLRFLFLFLSGLLLFCLFDLMCCRSNALVSWSQLPAPAPLILFCFSLSIYFAYFLFVAIRRAVERYTQREYERTDPEKLVRELLFVVLYIPSAQLFTGVLTCDLYDYAQPYVYAIPTDLCWSGTRPLSASRSVFVLLFCLLLLLLVLSILCGFLGFLFCFHPCVFAGPHLYLGALAGVCVFVVFPAALLNELVSDTRDQAFQFVPKYRLINQLCDFVFVAITTFWQQVTPGQFLCLCSCVFVCVVFCSCFLRLCLFLLSVLSVCFCFPFSVLFGLRSPLSLICFLRFAAYIAIVPCTLGLFALFCYNVYQQPCLASGRIINHMQSAAYAGV